MVKLDIITMGSATVDVFAEVPVDLEHIKLGEKILINRLEFEIGGGGTNSAVALSRLGLNVAYLGKFGSDDNAKTIISDLKKEKVKVINLKKSKQKTAYSMILHTKGKDRVIFTYKGASNDLDSSEIKKSDINSKWIYMASLVKKSLDAQIKVANIAKQNKIKILFNPSEYLIKNNKDKIKLILKNTEILVLNLLEAQLLSNSKEIDLKLLLKLQEKGPKSIIVTNGKDKIIAYHDNSYYEIMPLDVKVIQTAGAGDAFTSGFLSSYIKSNDFTFSLKRGVINSCNVIQKIGTKTGLLKLNEIIKLEKKVKVDVKKFRVHT